MTSRLEIFCRSVLIGVALSVLPACGGGDRDNTVQSSPGGEGGEAEAASADLPDPCKLLSDEEINAVLDTMNNGYKTAARTFMPFPDIGGGQCNIEAKNEQGYTTSFSISVSPAGAGSLFIERGARTPISGIGDEAFEARDNYYAIVKGVLVHIVNAPGASQTEGSTTLLRAAAGRV